MDTKVRLSGFFRKWQQARAEVKQAKQARRDEREGEELQMARDGAKNRFPPMHG